MGGFFECLVDHTALGTSGVQWAPQVAELTVKILKLALSQFLKELFVALFFSGCPGGAPFDHVGDDAKRQGDQGEQRSGRGLCDDA